MSAKDRLPCSSLSVGLRVAYLTLVYAFFYLPIVILIVYSFNNARFSASWQGFSLVWYRELLAHDMLWTATGHSLCVGIVAASMATVLGTIGAYSLVRYRFWGRQLMHALNFVLIVTPDVVLGVSLLVLFSTLKFSLGFLSLLIGHVCVCFPFVAVLMYGRIAGIDRNIFEAAKDLGAGEVKTFFDIILPQLFSAFIASWMLSFALSFDEVIVSYFVSGPGFEILPLQIFSMVRHGVSPEINALCTVTFGLTLLIVVIAQSLLKDEVV